MTYQLLLKMNPEKLNNLPWYVVHEASTEQCDLGINQQRLEIPLADPSAICSPTDVYHTPYTLTLKLT